MLLTVSLRRHSEGPAFTSGRGIWRTLKTPHNRLTRCRLPYWAFTTLAGERDGVVSDPDVPVTVIL
jgi:hypothetical protein